jgi:hypothetical protein
MFTDGGSDVLHDMESLKSLAFRQGFFHYYHGWADRVRIDRLHVMNTTSPSVKLYSKKVRKLFPEDQQEYFSSIEINYQLLQEQCVEKIELPQSGTHKNWVKSRVKMHTNSAIMRLLYLTESFCQSAISFNGAACANTVKGMVEVPLHLGYILWILSPEHDFEKIRTELAKIAFGDRDAKTGLTSVVKVKHKTMYEKADEQMSRLFEDKRVVDIFERLYKESNAVGHHNHEATMFCGLQSGGVWNAKDRREIFLFLVNNIFQLFLFVSTVLFMSVTFLKAIQHHQEQRSNYF